MSAATGSLGSPGSPPFPMLPRRFRVLTTRHDNHDTLTVQLEPCEGQALGFAAGQFTMLQVFGVGEVPISISGDPRGAGPLQHTIRDVGSVSHALAAAAPGQLLGVRGPYGTGWDVADGKGGDVVLVAGGIGLAPLRPALLEICAEREDYARVSLLYGARTPSDVLFGEDLRSWAEDHRITVEVIVDRGEAGWTGRIGLVTQLIGKVAFGADRRLALVCGPEVMMRHSAVALVARGVDSSRIRLSMERNMKCGIGLCGHCQLRELFLCQDGPVLPFDRLEPLITRAEL